MNTSKFKYHGDIFKHFLRKHFKCILIIDACLSVCQALDVTNSTDLLNVQLEFMFM